MAKIDARPVNAPSKDTKPEAEPKTDTQVPDEAYLGTWKTKEAAEEGLGNMQKVLDSQGNELGALRKQTDFMQNQMANMQQPQPAAEPAKPEGPDYGKELAKVQKDKAGLDPDEPTYTKDMAALDAKAYGLIQEQTTQNVLGMATAEFQKALDERDVQATHKDFYRDHPDFNDPEMQMRIQENIAADPSGMADPLSAYWQIKAQDSEEALGTMGEENTEFKRLLDLKAGEDETGKVVTKAQSANQQETKKPKATGADLDKGMQEALNALNT